MQRCMWRWVWKKRKDNAETRSAQRSAEPLATGLKSEIKMRSETESRVVASCARAVVGFGLAVAAISFVAWNHAAAQSGIAPNPQSAPAKVKIEVHAERGEGA